MPQTSFLEEAYLTFALLLALTYFTVQRKYTWFFSLLRMPICTMDITRLVRENVAHNTIKQMCSWEEGKRL